MNKMEWDSIRYFLAIVRNRSLTGAAKELNVSASTVSRNLELLENTINIPLFVRHQSGYILNDHGQALKEKAEELEDAALSFEAIAQSRNKEASGTVSIATAENIANQIIIPAMSDFFQTYPSITIDLLTGIPPINIGKREADIALRLSRPDRGNVLIRKLGVQAWAFYRSKRSNLEISEPLTESSIQLYPTICWSETMVSLAVPSWLNQFMNHSTTSIKCSSLQGLYSAAKAGFGIALLPCFMGDTSEELTKIAFKGDLVQEEIWLVINQDMRHSKSVGLVADFLAEVVKKNAPLFSGKAENLKTVDQL